MALSARAWLLLLAPIGCTLESTDDELFEEAEHAEVEAPPPARSTVAEAPGPATLPAPSASTAPSCPAHLRCDFDALSRDSKLAIDAIRVEKSAHRMYLLADDLAVKRYSVALGWGGSGNKRREGDGVTPVGSYKLTGRLQTSPWHVLIGVSYPNYDDVLRFAASKRAGEVPPNADIGFGIALHGRPKDALDGEHKKTDWTAGCIAVDNDEIEEIAGLVKTGTPITIVD
jgi:hypothetical protein